MQKTQAPAGPQVFNMADQYECQAGLAAAAEALAQGRLVAFPTETVYGLGADASSPAAVLGIFAAKGRPADNPLIVHIPSLEQLSSLASAIPDQLYALADRFWPGPLTVVLPKSPAVPDAVTAGLNTVAIRIPNHPVALAMLEKCGLPVAAPSANRSGKPSTTTAAHVLADVGTQVAVVLDGGPCGVGLESTVLDLTTPTPTVLRPGGVTMEQLADVLGAVQLDPRAAAVPSSLESDLPVRSPGMKYRHYAPAAPATLVEGEPAALWSAIWQLVQSEKSKGVVGVIVSNEGKRWLEERHGSESEKQNVVFEVVGSRSNPEEIARRIFAGLRSIDAAGVRSVVIEGVPTQGLGLAIMNRLRHAAGRIYYAAENGTHLQTPK